MSLIALLNNQTITIDDHKRGAREIKNWDNPSSDIHLEKKTKYKIEGFYQEVIIKISLNADRPIISIDSKKKKLEVPKKLLKEIRQAFFDLRKVDAFISDLVQILKNYASIYNDEEKVIKAMKMI